MTHIGVETRLARSGRLEQLRTVTRGARSADRAPFFFYTIILGQPLKEAALTSRKEGTDGKYKPHSHTLGGIYEIGTTAFGVCEAATAVCGTGGHELTSTEEDTGIPGDSTTPLSPERKRKILAQLGERARDEYELMSSIKKLAFQTYLLGARFRDLFDREG